MMLSFGEGELIGIVGKAPVYTEAASGFGYWALIDGSELGLECCFIVPHDFKVNTNVDLRVWWYPSGNGVLNADTIKYEMGVGHQQLGVFRVADTTYAQDLVVPVGSGQGIWVVATTTLAAVPWARGDMIHCRFKRYGGAVGDNFAGTMVVMLLEVRYTATSP